MIKPFYQLGGALFRSVQAKLLVDAKGDVVGFSQDWMRYYRGKLPCHNSSDDRFHLSMEGASQVRIFNDWSGVKRYIVQ